MLPGLKKRALNFHDVLMYVAIGRKHLRLMVLLLCFCWLLGLVYYVYARPVYYSRSLVKIDAIERQVSAEKEFGEAYRTGSIISELTAPHIVERTAAKLGIVADYRTLQKDYVKKISAKHNSERNLELEVWPYSLDWAKRWGETMVSEYLQYRRERRATEAKQRQENYLRDRDEQLRLLESNRAKLTRSRSELDTERTIIEFEELKTLHSDLVTVGIQLDEVGQVRIQVLSPELGTIEKLSRITAVIDRPMQLGSTATPSADKQPAGNTTVQVVTPAMAVPSTAWQEMERELNVLKAQRDELGQTYLPGHAKMVAIQEQMDAINLRLNGELRTALDRLDTYHRMLLDRQRALNEKLPEFERRLAKFNSVRQQEELVKDSMVTWQNLITKLEKDHQTDLYALDRDRVSVMFGGVLQTNDLPVSPNRMGLLIYTTLLGLMLALGVPFLVEYLDHTLSNLEQVESAFQIRGLGIVPKVESESEPSVGFMGHDESKETNLLENFRVIRTNLLSMGALSKPPHVLMVTSAMPKEGKTVVSSNLALSFAQTGAKTLLLDTDLRRGRLHRLFGYRKQPGLSGVLLGQVTLDEAIRPTHHENLSVLSTGQHIESGTELLGAQKFKDLMAELRQRFDRIVMDTPPVLGLSETSVLQKEVDGVLFVIWSGHTPIKGVRSAVEMLQANGANFYGFVLNRLDLSSTANYYQYYYYSHDYYYHYSPRALENA
jgi:polysaccharide biosynthesis transport protein